MRAEQAGVDEVHDRPELAEPVLDRRARHREPRRAGSRRSARARFVAGFFASWASSSSSRSQAIVASGSISRVAMSYEVTTTSDSAAARRARRRQPAGAVVEVDAERGREALDLLHPLPGDAHRADDERRAERVGAGLLALGDEHRDRLHGLSEAHVVGEDRADAEVAEHAQPAVAALLEREQRMLIPAGVGSGWKRVRRRRRAAR